MSAPSRPARIDDRPDDGERLDILRAGSPGPARRRRAREATPLRARGADDRQNRRVPMARAPEAAFRSIVVAAAVATLGLSSTAVAQSAVPTVTRDPGVVLSWNAIAFRTISVEGLKPPQVTELYLALVSTAVYNAVVTIEGGGAPTLD